MVIEGLLYTKDHEWARIEGGVATIGITDYAQQMLGELVFVELPAIGKECAGNDELALVESTKAANDIYSPVAGRVIEVNDKLESQPELINQDCYSVGWICRLQIFDTKSFESLMDSKQYEEYLAGR
ncbi:MAG TPA: glycine cleavage system protein GcvH [Sedimentisphaerales bacterium]|nr:glycine cleavage system protein GcvH [Sedimentisphaerales bacterium]